MVLKLNKIQGLPFPEDGKNYLVEIDFEDTGTYRCTMLTSFYLLYIDQFDIADSRTSWERELKSRVSLHGLERAKLFQTEMLNLGLHPDNFWPTLELLWLQLPHRVISIDS